jgi:hypothetical protein
MCEVPLMSKVKTRFFLMNTFLPHLPEFNASPDIIRRLLTLGSFVLRMGRKITHQVREMY